MAMEVSPIIDVAQKYKVEFVEMAQILQHQAMEASNGFQGKAKSLQDKMIGLRQEMEPKVVQLAEKTQKVVQNMGPVDAQPKTNHLLLENYLWSAICLFGLGCGEFLGRFLFCYPLCLLLSTPVTVTLQFVLIPAWFVLFDRKDADKEGEARMKLFQMSVAAGVLSGYNLSTRQLPFFAPPAFLLPLTMAITCFTLGSKFANDRRIYLGLTVGSATLLYLIFGLVFQSLGFGYLLWVVLAAGVSALHLQLQLGRIGEGKVAALSSQLCMIMGALLLESMMTVLFGTTAKDENKAAPSPVKASQ